MADLQVLRELCEWLAQPSGRDALANARAHGLTSLRAGELELHFVPSVAPPPPADDSDDSEDPPPTERERTADDDERHALEELLHSSGADAGPLLDMRRRAVARDAERRQA